MSRARTGKIARAPFDVRARVNEMLRDGRPAKDLIKFLESKDIFGVDDDVVTRWRQGGYQDWLASQDRAADMKSRQEFAMEIVRANEGSKLGEAALYLASDQLYQVLTDFDLTSLKELLVDKPENYAAIVNSLAKLSKGALDLRKYQDAVSAAQKEIQKLRDPKQDLSDDDRKAIVDKVDEILGLKK
jgi:hypothetical protein